MSGKRWLVIVLLGFALVACGDDDSTGQDGSVGQDVGVGADAAPVIECTPSVDQCPGSLSCECCGSIGPAAICVCTMACNTDNDCTNPDLPHCNTPGAGTPGICTTEDYNCCWMCQ
ncbi:MAG: hypothetical protein ABI333_00595 [bacterium]